MEKINDVEWAQLKMFSWGQEDTRISLIFIHQMQIKLHSIKNIDTFHKKKKNFIFLDNNQIKIHSPPPPLFLLLDNLPVFWISSSILSPVNAEILITSSMWRSAKALLITSSVRRSSCGSGVSRSHLFTTRILGTLLRCCFTSTLHLYLKISPLVQKEDWHKSVRTWGLGVWCRQSWSTASAPRQCQGRPGAGVCRHSKHYYSK